MKVAEYLVQTLNTLGIEEIFGLPGDFNFKIVEAIEKNPNVNWIGSTNELNAGYATDGYARIKGFGAIVTTYGVGELSAINAIAGAKAENVPIVKITGVPSTRHIEKKSLLHHNLETADYYAFYNAYKNVVEDSAFLTKENAKKEIDRLINVMIRTKKPVYIALPDDVCDVEINGEFVLEENVSDKENLKNAIEKIKKLVETSKNPVVIADILTTRFGAVEELNKLLKTTNIPSCSFIRGVDIVKAPNYFGCYVGHHDNKPCYDYVNSSDCIIISGGVLSDLNTMGFDYRFKKEDIIDIQADFVRVKGEKFENVLIKDLLSELNKVLEYRYDKTFERTFKYNKAKVATDDKLTTDFIYNKLNEFLKENDIYVNEVGLPSFGTMLMDLKDNISVQNQILWGSIGWATPCTFGCAMADKNRRTILVSGDGSHQLTFQEISAMMRNNVKPIIFIINNSGYTVERILCNDVHYKYNDIASWNYSILPQAFRGECFCAKCTTEKEFVEVLDKIEKEDKMCYIELQTDYLNIPKLAMNIAKHPEQLR